MITTNHKGGSAIEIKTLANGESVMKRLEAIRQEVSDKTKKGSTEEMNSNYTAVSRDGDTLEISEGKSETKMSDAALANCSKQKLQQLLSMHTVVFFGMHSFWLVYIL